MKAGDALPFPLPHVGGKPISIRITADLLHALREGEFATCSVLPSEMQLAGRYGVSRSVIRDALSALEREGFLERMRGIGTVIHRDIVNLQSRLDLKIEYNDLIRSMGYQPTTELVELGEAPADEKLSTALEVDVGAPLLVCKKLLRAGAKPVIYSIDHLPLRLFQGSDPARMDWKMPLFDLLENHLGIAVDTDIASISASLGAPAIRKMLDMEEGEALFLIDEVGYYRLKQPIFHSYGFYSNFFSFTMLRKRL